ncbi:hypothetical protein QUB37_14545 [Microcoleus sp. AT3-A2]|uniref:hypothetical protein n=1 Tax=Microcoleus sp. AT3-A2 TaxID=2818610 RepID=UPI002FD3BB8C
MPFLDFTQGFTSELKGAPTSTETMTAVYFPLSVSCLATASMAVVLPTCRGAWMTK